MTEAKIELGSGHRVTVTPLGRIDRRVSVDVQLAGGVSVTMYLDRRAAEALRSALDAALHEDAPDEETQR